MTENVGGGVERAPGPPAQEPGPTPPTPGSAGPEARGSGVDRKIMWLAIAGGVGIVIGIVALIIAISAKNATNNDAKVTAAVNRAARLAVVGLHNQLQHDVASATTVLRQLQASGAAAAKTRQDLLRDINRNKTALAISNGTITKLQTSVNTVTGEVHKLQTTVTNLGSAQQQLTKRVNALSSQTTTTSTTTP